MRRANRSGVRQSFPRLVFAAVLVLGLGLAAWALKEIGDQPRGLAYTESSYGRAEPPTSAAEPADRGALSATATARPATQTVSGQPYPEKGEEFGTLTIPALERTLPIIEGTDDEELARGVGHFSGSVLPGVADNCVLSGHRDTVFRGLGKLVIGDELVVRTAAGEFTYKIGDIRIVDKDDKTVIVPTEGAVLTVTTCYPFNYVGSAPDRYILSADLAYSRPTRRAVTWEQRLPR